MWFDVVKTFVDEIFGILLIEWELRIYASMNEDVGVCLVVESGVLHPSDVCGVNGFEGAAVGVERSLAATAGIGEELEHLFVTIEGLEELVFVVAEQMHELVFFL